jgi:hypothetical protein
MEKFPTLSGPEPENKCLGSLFMKLEAILVNPVASNLQQPQQIKLYLTIQFKEQRELLVGGHIKFGLKGGKLRVKLKNAEIPATSNQLGRSYELAVQKKKPSASIPQPEIQANLPTNEPPQFISCKVAVRGTPTRPIWVFEVDQGGSVLKGVLKNTALATLDITEKPCYIEATFEVAPRDIYLSEAEGLWPKNISKKKSVVIERAIIRRFLDLKLSPYLSRQTMRYD